jgi:hypothetical protein
VIEIAAAPACFVQTAAGAVASRRSRTYLKIPRARVDVKAGA